MKLYKNWTIKLTMQRHNWTASSIFGLQKGVKIRAYCAYSLSFLKQH